MHARLFDLLERTATLIRNEERAAGLGHGLQPVHLQVLRYISICNRYSDSPAAVVEYLGLTKGTISQTLLRLEAKQLLIKESDSRDRRVVHLRLTQAGHAVVASCLPPPTLQATLAALPDGGRALQAELELFLLTLQRTQGNRSFGVCHTCAHFQRRAGGARCGLTLEPLSMGDAARVCREHETP